MSDIQVEIPSDLTNKEETQQQSDHASPEDKQLPVRAEDDQNISQELFTSTSKTFIVDKDEISNLITETISTISNTKNKIPADDFLAEPLDSVAKINEEVQSLSGITKEDSKRLSFSIRSIIKEVTNSWNPPLTNSVLDDLNQIRDQLNKVLVALRDHEAQLNEFVIPEESFYNQYIIDTSPKVENPNDFFNAVKTAGKMVINRDIAYLEQASTDLSDYINNSKVPYDDLVKKMHYGFLYYLAASVKCSYFLRTELEESVQKFFETQPEQLNDVCFKILEHFYNIRKKANPRTIEKDHDTVVKDLYLSLYDPKKMDLASTYYYLLEYSLQSRDILLFKETLRDLKTCFHGQNDLTKIDFKQALAILKKDVPAGFLYYSKTLPDTYRSENLRIDKAADSPNLSQDFNPNYYYNNHLILNSIVPNGFVYNYAKSTNPANTVPRIQVANELTVTMKEIRASQGYIHVRGVGQVARYMSNSTRSLDCQFREAATIYRTQYNAPPISRLPQLRFNANTRFFNFQITNLTIDGRDVNDVIGMAYVLDNKSKRMMTEPLLFNYSNKQCTFINHGKAQAIFPLEFSEEQYFVLRLFHSNAINHAEFLNFINLKKNNATPLQSPFNFAVSAIPLHDKNHFFLASQSFPERFHLVSSNPNLTSDSDLIKELEKRSTQTIPIQTQIQLQQMVNLPPNMYTRSYLSRDAGMILMSSTNIQVMSSDPLLILSNLKFTFKNVPKGSSVYFTAFYLDSLDNVKSPKGLPNMLTYMSPDPQTQYVSSTLPSSTTCLFPDVVRIILKDKIPKTAHVIFHFYINPTDKGNKSVFYKAAVLPLFSSNGSPLQTDKTVDVPTFELKQVQPNNYIWPSKLFSISRFNCNVSIPSIYLLPPQVAEMATKTPNDQLNPIDVSQFSKEDQANTLLPIVSLFLSNISPTNVLPFVQYLANKDLLDKEQLDSLMSQFTFLVFDPTRYPDKFSDLFFQSYSQAIQPYLKNEQTADNVLNLINFLKTSSYFLNFATIILLVLKKENKPIEPSLLDHIITFSESISTLIGLMPALEMATEANATFSRYLLLVIHIIGYDKGLQIISDHLDRFNHDRIHDFDLDPLFPVIIETKSKQKPQPPPIPKPELTPFTLSVRGLDLKCDFIKTFGISNHLLANCAYSESTTIHIFENLFESARQSLNESPDIFKNFIVVLGEFVRINEHFHEISMNCANIYIPYLKLAMDLIDELTDPELYDYQFIQQFIIPVLFVLHTAEKKKVIEFYNNLSSTPDKDDKTRFIYFLETLILRSLRHSKQPTIDPTKPVDLSQYQFIRDEYQKIHIISTVSKDVSYIFFNEVTVRILDFVAHYLSQAKSTDIEDPQATAFAKLFDRLVNFNQLDVNFYDIALTISKFVDAYYSKFYFNHTHAFNHLVTTALTLVRRHLRIARSTGVALLIHFIFIDYYTTENIVASMHYFLNNLVSALYECPLYRMAIYKALLDRIRLFVTSYHYDDWITNVLDHLNKARVIYDSITVLRSPSKAPELHIQMMRQIADTLNTYPLLRLRWLRKIVQYNQQYFFYAQAFEGQMHVVALIDRMIRLLDKEHIPELDYSFVEEAAQEKTIDINQCNPALRHLLIKDLVPEDDVFNSAGLIKNLNFAIKQGKAAALFWEVRECYYLFLSIYESQRKPSKLTRTVMKLGQTYNKINEREEAWLSTPAAQIGTYSPAISATPASSQSGLDSSAPSAAQLLLMAQQMKSGNGKDEESDSFKPPAENQVDPTSTPLYFYLVERIHDGQYESRKVYATTISNLNDFAKYLNEPTDKRFEYGQKCVAYETSDAAKQKELNGIVVSPIESAIDCSFTNKATTFVQNSYYGSMGIDRLAQKRYIIKTAIPHPNSNIVAPVLTVESKSYTKYEAFQLRVEESIANMKTARETLQGSLPKMQSNEKWQKVKPHLSVTPLVKAIIRAINGQDLALPIIRDVKRNPGSHEKEANQFINRWVDELEMSYNALVSISQEESKSSQTVTERNQHIKTQINNIISPLVKYRQIQDKAIPLSKDPILYFRDYEEF